MNALVVSKRLADGLVSHLAERRDDVKGALGAWRSAETEASASRERETAALDAAHAAQLSHGDDEEELTRHAAELQADAERAAYAARRARTSLANSVTDAEIAAIRAHEKSPRMALEDAAVVDCAVHEVTALARAAREEARLGPSPDDAARQTRDAPALAAAPAESSNARDEEPASTTDTPRKKRHGPKQPKIVIIDGVEFVLGIDSMVLVLQAELVGCRPQTVVDALNKKGGIEGAVTFGEGKNPPWAVPRRALVAWGLTRRNLPVAP